MDGNRNNQKTYLVADFFAGMGAFTLGAENTGRTQSVFSCEKDTHAQATYAANFGPVTAGDVLNVDLAKMPDVDVVLGGPPCQDFSAMGKRAGLSGSRGTLTAVFGETLRVKQPLAFVMENVKGLLSSKGGQDFKKVREQFDQAGYAFFAKVCDAQDHGVAQHRERLMVVGLRKDLNATFVFPKGVGRNATLESVLEKNVPAKYFLSKRYAKSLKERTERNAAKGNGFGMAVPDLGSVANTLTVGGSGRERNLVVAKAPAGSGKADLRRLTPRECLRLQGFPESFKMPVSDTQAYKQTGNTVAVPLVEAIVGELVKVLDKALAARDAKTQVEAETHAASGAVDANKRGEGRYYTLGDPFADHPAFNRLMSGLPKDARLVEPFVGGGHLVAHLRKNGIENAVDGFDIAPAVAEIEGKPVVQRDTLADFPQGYDAVVMNPPYLSRASATRIGAAFPVGTKAQDLFEVALEKALTASPIVVAVIPGSFVTSSRHRERLVAVVELPNGLFGDTDHPTCLALFGQNLTADYEVWQGKRYLGMASVLASCLPVAVKQAEWRVNDVAGSIGLRAMDDSTGESIGFVIGSAVPAESVSANSKALTRISGVPVGMDPHRVIAQANALLRQWRAETGSVLICPFKGKRRRLNFSMAKHFLDAALMGLAANEEVFEMAA